MSSVCPACGVAVVPGYVRCPKCHAGLSLGARMKRATIVPGGTAVERKGFPISAVIVALGGAAAIIVGFGLRRGDQATLAAPSPLPPSIEATKPSPPPGAQNPATAKAASPPPEAAAPDLAVASADLEDTLRRQRLWGRVVITGPRIDVRSGSCADPAMRPLIDDKKPLLHGAGLTKLRCLEQSGAVVFERDL